MLHSVFKRLFKKETEAELLEADKTQLIKEMHLFLFSDEYQGKSPMSDEYQNKVHQKRKDLLNDDTIESWDFCKSEVGALLSSTKTAKTDLLIKYLEQAFENQDKVDAIIERQMTPIKDIDYNDPSTWSEVIIANRYSLLCAADSWDLDSDSTPSFEEFKRLLIEDPEFRSANRPINGMEREDYNPWKT